MNFDRVSILIFEPYYKVEFNLFFFLVGNFSMLLMETVQFQKYFFF